MNELSEIGFEKELESIRLETDYDKILQKIKMLKVLEEALRAQNRFEQLSIKYAKLQAETLVRCYQIKKSSHITGMKGGLNGKLASVAKWLAEMGETERQKYIDMCNEGLTITVVYNREFIIKRDEERADKVAKRIESEIMSDLEQYGAVNPQDSFSEIRSAYRKVGDWQTGNDIVDGIRNRMRQKGAVGTGISKNYAGVYVIPGQCQDNQVLADAIYGRIVSISRDSRKLSELIENSNITYNDLVESCNKYSNGRGWNEESGELIDSFNVEIEIREILFFAFAYADFFNFQKPSESQLEAYRKGNKKAG